MDRGNRSEEEILPMEKRKCLVIRGEEMKLDKDEPNKEMEWTCVADRSKWEAVAVAMMWDYSVMDEVEEKEEREEEDTNKLRNKEGGRKTRRECCVLC